jgi:hypothetical protein
VRDIERHKLLLEDSMQGLSDQEKEALQALRRRLLEQAGPVSSEQSDETLMETARNLFQQLGPADRELLAKLAGQWESRLRQFDK